MSKKKIQFIVNPVSGVGRQNMLDTYIRKVLDLDKFEPIVTQTRKPGDGTIIAREASGAGIGIVVAAGGDGTVNEVVRGLINTDSTLGIIPIGSGNGLAHHLNIPTNPASAINLINRESISKIDTVLINDHIFVSIAGVGFDARVAEKFAKSDRRGFLSYFRIVSKEYQKYKPKNYKLFIDGKEHETKALLISFANSNQFGYNTQIAPKARIDDGLIDVCIVKKVPIIELPVIAHLLYWKQIERSKYIEIIQAREVKLQQSKNRTINLDGEPVKLGRELNIKINPLSLKVITPE